MGYLREERIIRSGSPMYTVKVPAIVAGALKGYDLESQSDSALVGINRFLPVDFLEVTNDDVVPVYVIINHADQLYIPASTIKSVSDKNIWHVDVKNAHATTTSTADKIVMTLQKQPITEDKYLRRFKLSGGKLL